MILVQADTMTDTSLTFSMSICKILVSVVSLNLRICQINPNFPLCVADCENAGGPAADDQWKGDIFFMFTSNIKYPL